MFKYGKLILWVIIYAYTPRIVDFNSLSPEEDKRLRDSKTEIVIFPAGQNTKKEKSVKKYKNGKRVKVEEEKETMPAIIIDMTKLNFLYNQNK